MPVFRTRRSDLALVSLLTAAVITPIGATEMTEERRIDADAQKALAVTIYNDDLALVKDRRGLVLEPGANRLAWRRVSAHIRPETALLSEKSGGLGSVLVEQNFDFDLLNAQSLLKKYVGRRVSVIRTNDAGDREREEALVLAANDGVVLRYDDRIETGVVGHLSYPDVPADLRDEPTLVLHLEAQSGGDGEFELSYLTGGLQWKADYVADLSDDGARMDLNAWVTLTNESGVAYRDAQVQLVAGEVNQVAPPPSPMMMERTMVMDAAAAMPEQEALDEYHLYTLPRRTDILNRQTKQVALLAAPGVPVERELVVTGQSYQYRGPQGDGWIDLPVESRLKFVNRDGSLGIPLPAGVVRVYARDSRGNAQFVGEDAIDHTPKNETIDLKLGESFDVTVRRRQTDFKKIAGASRHNYRFETAFEIKLANAKDQPVRVRVQEQIPGDWQIIEQSAPHEKLAASLAQWLVEVPADGSVLLSWRAKVRF